MQKYFNDLKIICSQIRKGSTSMQRRLMLYFMSIVAVIICIFLVILALTDVFTFSGTHLNQGLTMALDNSVSKVEQQFDHINAHGIKLSSQISTEIEYQLKRNNKSFTDLNDNPAEIEQLQQAVFSLLNNTMELSECNGAYVILDITTNTKISNSENSRSGLYLRRTSVNSYNPVNSGTALYRGVKEVARKNKLELHNRWHMEFDTEKFPYYYDFKNSTPMRAAESYVWTQKTNLTDTWEKSMFLVVPVVGSQGEFYGICGVEISELYFMLAYPSSQSEMGTIITLLTPVSHNHLYLSQGLCGAENRGKFSEDDLDIKSGNTYNYYTCSGKKYVGLSQQAEISSSSIDDTRWMVTVLLPASSFSEYAFKNKLILVITFALLLVLMIFMSVFLSRRYVQPIKQQLQAIQKGDICNNTSTGLTEIDELLNFIQLQKQQDMAGEEQPIPDGIQEIFDSFIEKSKTLTNAEYNILRYYIEGYQIMEIPDLAFISISTVRRHNRSIYEKLGIASKDELMLYIDLLKRCDRLKELERLNITEK